MRNEVQRSCSFTPLWCLGAIVSPSIAQMSPNFAQVCTTTCQMVLAPCTSKLAWKFQKLHEKTQIYALIWTTSVWYNAKNCTKSLFTWSTPHFTGRSRVLLFFKPRSHFPPVKWISVDLSKTRQNWTTRAGLLESCAVNVTHISPPVHLKGLRFVYTVLAEIW